MIDRIDLKFVFRRNTDLNEIRNYALRKAEIEGIKQPDYTPFLIRYIEYAKRLNPEIIDEAKVMLVEFFTNLSYRGFGTNRVLETLFRISKAIARLKLKEIVDSEDAKETIEFYNVMLQDYQQVTNSPENPRDTSIKECVKTLKEKKFGIAFDELIKEVCANENNEYISRYSGFGHRSLEIKHNKKVRNVLEMLIKNPSIKRTNERPIVLQWFESELSDPSDLCDLQNTNLNPENNPITCDISNNSKLTNEKSRSLGSHRSLRCYYCIESFEFDSDYKKHVLNKHPKKYCYPDKPYIEKHGLIPQGKDWEKGN